MDFNLPEKFLHRMRDLLKNEYACYLSSFEKPYFRGIRINTLKTDYQRLRELLDITTKPLPFCTDGYYIPSAAGGLGKTPLHHAGAFYMQEPSAMSAVTMLNPQKGDKVLDLCAAPGGKSAQIGACLCGRGLLWSNEIVKNRANVLLSNIERMGIKNAVVSSCHPQQLCDKLQAFFDKVLVDAPCSGEGMFRKDRAAAAQWSEEHVRACANRQLSVLHSAAKALRAGGVLVYSTCTFSREENEGVIEKFLQNHPDFVLEGAAVSFGRPAMEKAIRIFPMDGGEGHFAAKLRKINETMQTAEMPGSYIYSDPFTGKNRPLKGVALYMYRDVFKHCPPGDCLAICGDKLLMLPAGLPNLDGLHILRAGVLLGKFCKNRFEPAHSAFMAAKPSELYRVLELDRKDDLLSGFLKGEEIPCDSGEKGYTAVSVNGIITGFGKCANGMLKNKYPKGLRNT